MTSKKFNISVLSATLLLLIVFASVTVYIDPYFHYHAPLQNMQYSLYEERYQNDGIVRHFTYNAVIAGTSMTENFKASEFNQLFGVNSIKVPLSGGPYKEVDETVKTALATHPNTKIVIRSLDDQYLVADKDMVYASIADGTYKYPYYLTDDDIFDDVAYILNKTVFWNDDYVTIKNTMSGVKGTTFDSYSSWSRFYTFGKKSVLATYNRPKPSGKVPFTPEIRLEVQKNIQQNVIKTAKQYPNTEFYLFFTPYSICSWDCTKRNGQVDYMVDAEKTAIEELLQCSNIKLFSFANDFGLTCNLNNYKDKLHYGDWVNSMIMHAMHDGQYRLTKNNYMAYLDQIRNFYSHYDYEQIYN